MRSGKGSSRHGGLPAVEGVAIHGWLASPLPPDVGRSLDRLARGPGVRHMAVMPDVHLSGEACVGVALASEGVVYPAAVGGDIGCGMTAARFDLPAEAVRGHPALQNPTTNCVWIAVPV